MSPPRMAAEVPYAGRPSYELRSSFLRRPPWRISAQVVRPTAGRAEVATDRIASSRFSISIGSGGGASGTRPASQTSQQAPVASGGGGGAPRGGGGARPPLPPPPAAPSSPARGPRPLPPP